MIAAARAEMITLFGSRGMRVLALLAALSPLIAWALSNFFYAAISEWHAPAVGYSEALFIALPFAGLGSLLAAAQVATFAHRYQVYQSFVATGHPRDLLFAGRLLVVCGTALVIAACSVTSALLLHWFTYDHQKYPMDPEFSDSITLFSAGEVAADIVTLLLLVMAGCMVIVGLGALLRGAAKLAVLIGGVILANVILVDFAHQRYSERAEFVPLAQAEGFPPRFADPWWSPIHAVNCLLNSALVHGEAYAESVALSTTVAAGVVVTCILIACTAGLYRMVMTDA